MIISKHQTPDSQLRPRGSTDLNGEHVPCKGLGSLSNLKQSHSLFGLFDDARNVIKVRDSPAKASQLFLFILGACLVGGYARRNGRLSLSAQNDLGSEPSAQIFMPWEGNLSESFEDRALTYRTSITGGSNV